jgi:hypothetical protein
VFCGELTDAWVATDFTHFSKKSGAVTPGAMDGAARAVYARPVRQSQIGKAGQERGQERGHSCPPYDSPAGDWLTPGRFGLLLGLLIFAAFPQVLLGLHTFVVRDFGFFAYPLANYQRECFLQGDLPFWNPYNNCGTPFLAQWNTMPLYPPALLYLLLPLGWSLSFFCLLHLFLAGMGMYVLGFRWTGNRLAAAVAGLVFAFNGLSLNLLMWPSHIATLAWMPWVIWSVEQGWQRGGRKLALAAIIGALQMLAGGPETILLTWLLLAALWLTQLRVASWRFPAVVLLVAGLAAMQLLPFLDLTAHSQRDTGYADTRWSMPGWGWANFLVPRVFGHVWSMGVFFQYDQSWTSSYYLGIGALLLALLALLSLRQTRVLLLGLAAGLAFLLALGDHSTLYRGLRHLLPQLSLITYPVKFVTVIAFVVPLLAAFALARLQAPGPRMQIRRRLLVLSGLLLLLITAVLLWAWLCPFPSDDYPATLRNGLSRAALLAVAAGLLLLLQRASGRGCALAEFGLPLALLVVLWMDVWTHEPNQNPGVPPSVYQAEMVREKLETEGKPQPVLGRSRAMVSPAAEARFISFVVSDPQNNFLAKRLAYFCDCNLLDHAPKVNGFFSLYPKENGELMSVLYGSTNTSYPHLMDFMGVSEVTAPNQLLDWTPRTTALPLITVGQSPVFLDDANALHSILQPNFDGAKTVFLPLEARAMVQATNPAFARVLSSNFKAERVSFEVEADGPALAVISQTWYHRWQAEVDGQPVPLLRANYAFQAVEVPAGRHQVELVYRDGAFRAGAWISGLGLVVCLALLLRRSRRGLLTGV